MSAIAQGTGFRVIPDRIGRYELVLDGHRAERVAAADEREIDLSPRAVTENEEAQRLGGIASSIDVSAYVALGLLALAALELVLRLLGARGAAVSEQPSAVSSRES